MSVRTLDSPAHCAVCDTWTTRLVPACDCKLNLKQAIRNLKRTNRQLVDENFMLRQRVVDLQAQVAKSFVR